MLCGMPLEVCCCFVFFILSVLLANVFCVDEATTSITKFSNYVKFEDMPVVKSVKQPLNPPSLLELGDIGTFNLHRSRIPTNLFRSIVEEMDVLQDQYGPLSQAADSAQDNEETLSQETRSHLRVLSPVR